MMNMKLDIIIYLIWIPTFLICSIIDYYSDFKIDEKIISNNIIDEILQENKIEISKNNLDELIKASECVGSKEVRFLLELKKSGLYLNTKSLIICFLGMVLGYFSSTINKFNIDEFDNNIKNIFMFFS